MTCFRQNEEGVNTSNIYTTIDGAMYVDDPARYKLGVPYSRSASQDLGGALIAPGGGSYGYAFTSLDVVVYNPSTVYNMLVVVNWAWQFNFQLTSDTSGGTSTMSVVGRNYVNGTYGQSPVSYSAYGGGNHGVNSFITLTETYIVPPEATYSFGAGQIWSITGNRNVQFFDANSVVKAYCSSLKSH